jgi:nitrogen fixation protein NifU and related proteins
MFSESLLDHFRNPRNVGELPPPALTVQVTNPVCGDIFRLSATLHGGTVTGARYKTRGCTASIAAGSAVAEWIVGKTLAELAAFNAATVEEQVGGLSNETRHAAVLCAEGVQALIRAASAKS